MIPGGDILFWKCFIYIKCLCKEIMKCIQWQRNASLQRALTKCHVVLGRRLQGFEFQASESQHHIQPLNIWMCVALTPLFRVPLWLTYCLLMDGLSWHTGAHIVKREKVLMPQPPFAFMRIITRKRLSVSTAYKKDNSFKIVFFLFFCTLFILHFQWVNEWRLQEISSVDLILIWTVFFFLFSFNLIPQGVNAILLLLQQSTNQRKIMWLQVKQFLKKKVNNYIIKY